jgi:hypothetical protein
MDFQAFYEGISTVSFYQMLKENALFPCKPFFKFLDPRRFLGYFIVAPGTLHHFAPGTHGAIPASLDPVLLPEFISAEITAHHRIPVVRRILLSR